MDRSYSERRYLIPFRATLLPQIFTDVLVIGAGVAGLAAIGTSTSLGAITLAFDVRPEVSEQIESMGAEFVFLDFEESSQDSSATGGYAAPSSPEFREAQLAKFRELADTTLAGLGDGVENGSQTGMSFPVLVKSSALMALYSIHSDRVFLDQLRYNSLFQWFLDLGPGAGYDADAFSGDRQEALARDSSHRFFDELVPRAGRERLFSSDRLQANGRQIKGWMSAGASA